MASRRRRQSATVGSAADRVAAVFRSAPFPVYGLSSTDRVWLRRLGPVPPSWPVETVELVHERSGSDCEVRVETSIQRRCDDWYSRVAVAFARWSRRPPPGSHLSFEEVRQLNRETTELVAALNEETWLETALVVDSQAWRFDLLEDDRNWVAQATLGAVLATIFARDVQPSDVALARIADLAPYLAGEDRTKRVARPVRLGSRR
jgi:hypothetical protein